MKRTVKKVDFYGIFLFIVFVFWSLFSYYIYEKNSYLGRMLNAWGLIVLIFGEALVMYIFNKDQMMTIRKK